MPKDKSKHIKYTTPDENYKKRIKNLKIKYKKQKEILAMLREKNRKLSTEIKYASKIFGKAWNIVMKSLNEENTETNISDYVQENEYLDISDNDVQSIYKDDSESLIHTDDTYFQDNDFQEIPNELSNEDEKIQDENESEFQNNTYVQNENELEFQEILNEYNCNHDNNYIENTSNILEIQSNSTNENQNSIIFSNNLDQITNVTYTYDELVQYLYSCNKFETSN
jgi:hypothetical protein